MGDNSKIIPIKSINESVPTKINPERTGERVLDPARFRDLKMVGTDSNISSLPDLNDIVIEKNKPIEDRLVSFAKQIKNPYHFKIGEFTVKVEYGERTNLSEALVSILNAS